MRVAILMLVAAVGAQGRDIPFDGNNFLRADRWADYRITDHRIELTRGVVVFHIADSGAPPVEIVTPSVSVQPYFVGDYRVEVNRSGQSIITPFGADLRVVAPVGAQWIAPGEKMLARGSAANPEFRIVNAVSRWRRLATRIANAVQIASVFSGGSGGATVETTQEQSSGGSSSPAPAKAETPKSAPPRPNDSAPRSTTPSARGK